MALPDAVRDWFAQFTDTPADPTETPEPVGEGEDPTTETDPDLNPDAPTEQGDDTGQDDAPADENTDTTGGDRTAPEPESPLSDDERDAINTVAAENEALRQENNDLRNRIAELGGDAALGIVEEVVEDPTIDTDTDDEYDPDADIADQESELRRLRGE